MDDLSELEWSEAEDEYDVDDFSYVKTYSVQFQKVSVILNPPPDDDDEYIF